MTSHQPPSASRPAVTRRRSLGGIVLGAVIVALAVAALTGALQSEAHLLLRIPWAATATFFAIVGAFGIHESTQIKEREGRGILHGTCHDQLHPKEDQ